MMSGKSDKSGAPELSGNGRTVKSKVAFLKAMDAALGIVTLAAQKAKMSRDTHYAWMKEDARYRAKVESIEDKFLDLSEAALASLIKDKNPQAVMFHLRTKGKRRGYVERTEIDNRISGVAFERPEDFLEKLFSRAEDKRKARAAPVQP